MTRKRPLITDSPEERLQKRLKDNTEFSDEEFLGGLTPLESDIIRTELDDPGLFDGKTFNFNIMLKEGVEKWSLPYLTRNIFIIMQAKGANLEELTLDNIFWLLKRFLKDPARYDFITDTLISDYGLLPFTHLYNDWLEASNLA